MEFIANLTLQGPCIYGLKFDDSIYVGVTTNIYERMASHLRALRNGKHRCRELQSAFDNKKAIEVILISPLEEKVSGERERLTIETEWAAKLSKKYNVISAHCFVSQPNLKSWGEVGFITRKARLSTMTDEARAARNSKRKRPKSIMDLEEEKFAAQNL